MQAASFEEVLEQILLKDKRYHRDAYVFLREALDYTQKLVTKGTSKGSIRHVSGQELLAGIRDYALEQFGPMAITVLEEWGIKSCQEFGEMVFIMVENSLLAKTDQDSRADFEGGYDFHEAFTKPFLPKEKLSTQLPEAKPARA
ncbi:Minf_1886 family protein [Pedosphaera parvula]|uniref:Verruc_Plancto-restricted protein n=1 Tax=Pedosphaera parvula (strain Ellin514) TaxID=320771 RepID=B9XNG7_PEDPL|nr:Minf_1886 family protein [Pedosphaera parvula]EEF58626.1 conserved hypothetical protein [Pedosphaera parvula Ellin514]